MNEVSQNCCTEEVSIETLRVVDYPCTRLLILNRPQSLNALSLEMARHLLWLHLQRPHPGLAGPALYVLKGAGNKSFCAGGDVRDAVVRGILLPFLRTTYYINHHILTMPNPQVSLWNGYVMGGGVGISIHGRYRVASERAIFAMPETAIGLFPDNGMSYVLPRLPFPGLGLYLGLTGARLKGADLVHVGLATHYVPSASMDQLEERLCHIGASEAVEDCLEEFAVKELPPCTLEAQRGILESVFALRETTTVEGILDALHADGSDFAKGAIDMLSKMSPTCLKITLELMRRCMKLKTLKDSMSLEFIVIQRIALGGEFERGVRALLIDKTKDPKWDPKTLEEVTPTYWAQFFDDEGLVSWDPKTPVDGIM